MSHSIRCEPLPFPLVSDKAVAEDATLIPQSDNSLDEANPEFGDVLDSEIGDKHAEEQKKREPEAWTIFGVAPTIHQILQQEIPLSLAAPLAIEPERPPSGDQFLTPKLLEAGSLADPPFESGVGEGQQASKSQLPSLLDGLKPAEQKLPSALGDLCNFAEQIAEIASEPAKKASGMVAAQGAVMLPTSQTTEETAREQKIPLSADTFEAASFEQRIVVRAASTMRDVAPKRDMDLAEFTAVEFVTPEWSSFEELSESHDVQSVRPTESIEIAQAMRTHVQLLKSSGQEKLDVVFRPDANTELRLHVEKVNGQILVQARCDRGDFARLDASWNAIQQTLANQGVRVESLQHGGEFQNQQNRHQSPGAFQQQSNSERKQEQNFNEQKIAAPKATRPSAKSSVTVRGWQSWA